MTTQPGIVIRAPATSANLGPGFDAFGLALDLFDEVTVAPSAESTTVEITGEGADGPRGEDHLIVRMIRAAIDRLGERQPYGLRLRCTNRIPHGRGLGSSAAAICTGILAAEALTGGEIDTLVLATELEGHPDNVAACLLGGLAVAWEGDHGARAVRLAPHRALRPVALIPAQSLSTHAARGLLPESVPHADAAFTAGRAALLVTALTTDPSLLMDATEDRLHQAYRGAAMPGSRDLLDALRGKGIPAVISGAGPTILAFPQGDSELPKLGNEWHIQPLSVADRGAHVAVPETR